MSFALAQVLVRRGLGDEEAARTWLAARRSATIRRPSPGSTPPVDSGPRHVRGGHARDGARRLRRRRRLLDRHPRARAAQRWARTWTGTCPAGPRTATGSARRRSSGSPSAARACCSPPTARSRRSTRSRRRALLGLDVVVTDHHSPRADGSLPEAPIVHPAVCGYPCPDLCAAGVAYKFAAALLSGAGRDPAGADEDLDLVALATVADCVPLRDENRRLVREGLHALATSTKPGIRALLRVAKVDPGALDARAIGFRLAPRINAAGRLYRADAGLELVLTDDAERAAAIADELDHANAERRLTETRIVFEAEALVRELGEQPAYVLAGEGWHPGRHRDRRLADRRAPPPPVRDARHGRRRGDRLGALDPGLRPAGRARRRRRAPAAPRRAPRGGGLHDRARRRSTPSGPPSSRTRRRSWRRRTSFPRSASTPWWRATSSGWRWPRSSSGWRPSGSPTRRCRCSCRPRGWSTRARWARRAATCASRSRPAATAPGRSPSG